MLLLTWWVGQRSMPDAHSFQAVNAPAAVTYVHQLLVSLQSHMVSICPQLVSHQLCHILWVESLDLWLLWTIPKNCGKPKLCLSLASPGPLCTVLRSTWSGREGWTKSHSIALILCRQKETEKMFWAEYWSESCACYFYPLLEAGFGSAFVCWFWQPSFQHC